MMGTKDRHKLVNLESFLDLASENFESHVKIHLYTVQGNETDYQGEFDSFYSYCLYPFYDFEIDSLDLQVNYEEGEVYLSVYLKFDIKKFVNMRWVEKESI